MRRERSGSSMNGQGRDCYEGLSVFHLVDLQMSQKVPERRVQRTLVMNSPFQSEVSKVFPSEWLNSNKEKHLNTYLEVLKGATRVLEFFIYAYYVIWEIKKDEHLLQDTLHI